MVAAFPEPVPQYTMLGLILGRLARLRIGRMATMAMLAGPFAAALMAAQPGYVDSSVCASCHTNIAKNYARTGMGRSVRAISKTAAEREFDGSSFFHAPSRELFTFTLRDAVPWIRRSQPGPGGAETNVFEQRVDYVIGAGNEAISFLHRTRDNKLTEFPVTWYPEDGKAGGHWGMSPAYDRPDHPGFSREVNFACMLCHNAYPQATPVSDSPGETIFPAQLPEGIDCQRCHGPGQNHVDAAAHGKSAQEIRAGIVNPARLAQDRQNEVCLQCHLETTSSRLPASLLRVSRGVFSYRPGEPLAEFILALDRAPSAEHADSVELVSAPYRLAKSACTMAGGKPLTCTTCHDPHVALSREESVRKTETICASCHAALGNQHPARQDCVECHMPRTPAADVIHASITDHFISKPRAAAPTGAEINARNTTPYAGEVALYYPKSLAPGRANELALAIAQVQSNPVEALRRLNRITAGDTIQPADVAAEIGHAFLLLNQPQKAVTFYQQALTGSRDNLPWLTGLGNAQLAAGRPDAAAETFAKVAALAPWETDALFSLGQAYARQGKFTDAIRVLRDAVSRNPESAAAFNDLGGTLLRTGILKEAEDALREAVRIQPEFSSLRMNLADALIKDRKLGEAQEQLEEAIRIGGRAETAEGAWFAALLATDRQQQALDAWSASFKAHTAAAHNNLGTVFASENKADDAIREYRLAVAGDPQSALAQFNLGVTLYARGSKDEAIPFLKKAAASADAGISAAAKSVLEHAQ
jgi:predicted CXXCH cytochrome family protein